jgi:hypothetical protein
MTDDERLALAERAWMENRHDERAYLLAFARALESRVLAERQPSAKDQARRFVSDFTREMGFAMSDHAQEVMLNLFLRNVAHPTPDDARDAARYRWLRNEHFPTADNPPLAQVVWKFGSNRRGSEWANLIDGNDLDAAIDRARQDKEGS